MDFQAIIGNYYGLDWGVLAFGLLSTHYLTMGRLRLGFAIGIFTCICGFSAALLTGQNGFIIYNILLVGMNVRGIMRGDRRKPRTLEIPVANNDDALVTQQAALVRVHAR